MKRLTHLIAGAALTAAVLALPACKKQAPGNGDKKQSVYVKIEPIRAVPLVDAIEVSGTVKAFEDVTLSPEEGGVVREWTVEKGQHVKKGQVLGILKDDVLKPSYEAANAQYQMAELNAEKQQKVYAENGISELQYKNILFGRDAAKASSDLMKARWDHTRLRSPINGVFEDRYHEAGEMAPPGMPIARVVNASVVKIAADVPEKYAGQIRVGTAAVITLDAVPGDTLRGRVTYCGTTVSALNRTLAVEIRLPNPGLRLKPEMIAKVQLLRETKASTILVSEDIVQLVDRGREIVYVEQNGHAQERRLMLGGRQGNMVEVLNGLVAGDRLIVVGYQKLVDGTPVVVTQ